MVHVLEHIRRIHENVGYCCDNVINSCVLGLSSSAMVALVKAIKALNFKSKILRNGCYKVKPSLYIGLALSSGLIL